MAGRPLETRSPMGCSSLGLLDLAPECDPEEPPVDGIKPAYTRNNIPMDQPKPSDAPVKGQCRICGYVPSKWVGPHGNDPLKCVEELRWQICLLGFHPPGNPGPKKRAAGAR